MRISLKLGWWATLFDGIYIYIGLFLIKNFGTSFSYFRKISLFFCDPRKQAKIYNSLYTARARTPLDNKTVLSLSLFQLKVLESRVLSLSLSLSGSIYKLARAENNNARGDALFTFYL